MARTLLVLEKGKNRQKKGENGSLESHTEEVGMSNQCWSTGPNREEAAGVYFCPSMPAWEGRAGLGVGCHLLLPLFQDVEVKLSSCFLLPSQDRCVLILEHI